MHHLASAGQIPRQDEMPHYHPPLCDPTFVEHQIANLPVHLPQRIFVSIPIIRDARQLPADLVVPILRIRHVNVHNPVKDRQSHHRFISTTVVNDRQIQPRFHGNLQRGQDHRQLVCWSHQVDVMASLPRQG